MQRIFILLNLLLFCFAFDTGSHKDITVDVLTELGYSEYAQKLVILGGWFNDFYSYLNPLSFSAGSFQQLHMDSLFDDDQIKSYWDNFAVNANNLLVQTSGQQSEPELKFLLALGSSLHVVQDFYTHSNFKSVYTRKSCDCFNDITWLDKTEVRSGGIPKFITGHCPNVPGFCPEELRKREKKGSADHGSYCFGLNADSHVRENHIEAYVYAYVASYQFVKAAEQWVSPSFITTVKNHLGTYSNVMNEDLIYAYQLSMWSELPFYDKFKGSWKGPMSGDKKKYLPLFDNAVLLQSHVRDVFLNSNIYQSLTKNLYNFAPLNSTVPPIPKVSSLIGNFKVFVLRTLSASVFNVNAQDTNLFAEQFVNGQNITENEWKGFSSVRPFWTSIKIVNNATSSVNISYSLYNSIITRQVIDINPDSNLTSLPLSFNISSQVLSLLSANNTVVMSGNYNNPQNSLTIQGDAGSVSIFAFVASLGCSPNQQGCPIAKCDLGYPKPPFDFCPSNATNFNTAGNQLQCYPNLCSPDQALDVCSSSQMTIPLLLFFIFVLIIIL